MAEFMNEPRVKTRTTPLKENTGFGAFGKEVPLERRSEALKHIRSMGIVNTQDAWDCIGQMSEKIARDQPYEAMAIGMRYVDLTGTYRLLAVLCTDNNTTQKGAEK